MSITLYEGVIIVPNASYGAEAWGIRRKENILAMKCLIKKVLFLGPSVIIYKKSIRKFQQNGFKYYEVTPL